MPLFIASHQPSIDAGKGQCASILSSTCLVHLVWKKKCDHRSKYLAGKHIHNVTRTMIDSFVLLHFYGVICHSTPTDSIGLKNFIFDVTRNDRETWNNAPLLVGAIENYLSADKTTSIWRMLSSMSGLATASKYTKKFINFASYTRQLFSLAQISWPVFPHLEIYFWTNDVSWWLPMHTNWRKSKSEREK